MLVYLNNINRLYNFNWQITWNKFISLIKLWIVFWWQYSCHIFCFRTSSHFLFHFAMNWIKLFDLSRISGFFELYIFSNDEASIQNKYEFHNFRSIFPFFVFQWQAPTCFDLQLRLYQGDWSKKESGLTSKNNNVENY